MIISLNWLKKYVDIDMPTEKLEELIGSRLVEVEETIDLASKYAGATIVKVESVEKIAKSDHLHLCFVDDGGKVKGVERRTDGLVQIVCGCPNVRAGQLAVWLPPGTTVPETWGTGKEIVLTAKKLAGYESNGMLAGPDELGLGEFTNYLAEVGGTNLHPLFCHRHGFLRSNVPSRRNFLDSRIELGANFAKLFELNDTLLDIENKSLTHRPDCFGVIGFAREVAGILGKKFEEPEWLDLSAKPFRPITHRRLTTPTVTIVDPELCSRYQCAVLTDINREADSNGHVKTYLMRSGMRPISASVDITNMLMLETGQPLHAFDYDKLVKVSPTDKPDIVVRAAEQGEKLLLLDGKEIELSASDIVICAGDKKKSVPVALAGAIGGASTEIDNSTKNVLLESATFNLYNLRGTQFRHGIFSEAITRFTKGQPPALTEPVLARAVQQFVNFTGAVVASEVVDAYPHPAKPKSIKISAEQVNQLLGTNYSYVEIEKTLCNVGFGVSCDCGKVDKCDCKFINVNAPWWRTDIHITEDIIEEIGRLNGYDNIPTRLPQRGFTAPAPDHLGDLKSKIRQILSEAGANEVLTYSFISEKLLEKVGQDPKNSYKIINSISPELQYIRQMITPSLLEKINPNTRDKFDKFALFEMNQVFDKEYIKFHKNPEDGDVPVVENALGLTLATTQDNVFYIAKKYTEELFSKLGVDATYKPVTVTNSWTMPFEKKRSADIRDAKTDKILGIVGEYRSTIRKNFKLPNGTAGFEVNLNNLMLVMSNPVNITRDSDFPSVERDLTFKASTGLEYAKLESLIREELTNRNLRFELLPVSIYQGDNTSTKNLSFRLSFASYEDTLKPEEIDSIINQITKRAGTELKAEII